MDRVKALIKRINSYFKQNWNFDDYPIKTWKNPNAGEDKVAYGAGIICWSGIVGHGETPEKALIALRDSFNLYKDNNDDLPRPGTKVPFKFASAENIDKYEKTAVEFFKEVLNMDYYEGFFSDGSILAFFEPYDNDEVSNEKMKAEIIKRTLLRYNVDITEIYDEPLWKIFARIETERQTDENASS